MNSLIQEISEVIKAAPEQRHSYFQMKHFIIQKEPTHQARLWQCLRELQSRKDAMESINFEIEEVNDRLALIDIEEEKPYDKVVCQKEIEIRKRQYQRNRLKSMANINKLKEKLAFLNQEAKFFLECFKKLNEIEAVKDFDDLEAQTEYWNERFSQEVRLRTLLQLPLDAELAKTILSLADEIPIKAKLVASLQHVSEKLNANYLTAVKESNVQKKTI